MMTRLEFEKRKKEISVYFEILEVIELDKPQLSAFDIIGNIEKNVSFDSEKINIFRASAFLLLYNLVESTVFNSVISIFDAINSNSHTPLLKYKDVIDEIKLYWLNNLYKHDEMLKEQTIAKKIKGITDKVFNDSLALASSQIEYGGSIDSLKIRETAKSLGIQTNTITSGFRKETHGEALTDIKQKRNWLAHGEKTFAEIGQDYPFTSLNNWKTYTFEHLERYINAIEDYISNEKYKIQATPSTGIVL